VNIPRVVPLTGGIAAASLLMALGCG